jgi:hypothetical protein
LRVRIVLNDGILIRSAYFTSATSNIIFASAADFSIFLYFETSMKSDSSISLTSLSYSGRPRAILHIVGTPSNLSLFRSYLIERSTLPLIGFVIFGPANIGELSMPFESKLMFIYVVLSVVFRDLSCVLSSESFP